MVNAWTADQVAAGNLDEAEAAHARLSTVVEREVDREEGDDEGQAASDDGGQAVSLLPAIAVDAKTLRGARLDEGRAVQLVCAMTHREGATLAQRDVDTKTNELTAFAPLLAPLELTGVVVTADPLHAPRSHAKFLVDQNKAHYVFGLKDNQPRLREAAEALLADAPVALESHERGHGRPDQAGASPKGPDAAIYRITGRAPTDDLWQHHRSVSASTYRPTVDGARRFEDVAARPDDLARVAELAGSLEVKPWTSPVWRWPRP
ncbi:MAG: ISAs1 family transposase [Acidimicrobiales bacterium]